MPPVPAPAKLPTKVDEPEPMFMRVDEDWVMPVPKLVAGFCPERSNIPPELTVTAPVKVRVPVAPVAVLRVPVIPVVPVKV